MSVSAYLNYFLTTIKALHMSELIHRPVRLSSCVVHTSVTVQATPAESMQDNIRRQFEEHMPPVKIAYAFDKERSGRNPMLIKGELVLSIPSRQMKLEFSFHSGWRQATVRDTVQAYRLNGNQQMMNMLQILLALDLSVDARQEIIDIYFEYIMGFTHNQLGKI